MIELEENLKRFKNYIDKNKISEAYDMIYKIELGNLCNISYRNSCKFKYLKNKLKEKMTFKNMNILSRKKYESNLNKLTLYLAYDRYDEALKYCQKLYNDTNMPIFKYYLGYIFFMNGSHEDATKILLEYMDEGSEKYFESVRMLKIMNKNVEKYLIYN